LIIAKVRDRDIKLTPLEPVTSGSVGLQVKWEFDEHWRDLVKTAVFKGSGDARDVAIVHIFGQDKDVEFCLVPKDVLKEAGGPLEIGVYGRTTNGAIVKPTIWGRINFIRLGVELSEADPSEPEPDWTAQVQQIAAEALEKVNEIEDRANNGEFDGADGFSPTISVFSDDLGHSVFITDKDGDKHFFVPNGERGPVGPQGPQGIRGVSPRVSINDADGGHEVVITDMEGEHSFFVRDGDDSAGGVFIAEFDITTQEELDEAYNAGKMLLVRLPGRSIASLNQVVNRSGLYSYGFSLLNGEFEVQAIFANGIWSSFEYTFMQRDDVVLRYQGEENAGKYLVVGPGGYVTLTSKGGGGGEDEDTGGLIVEDEQGNTWHFLAGAGNDGDIVIEDEDGNLWHAPAGLGDEGDIPIEDESGGTWHLVSGSGSSGGGEDEGGGSLPSGGTNGQYLVKDSTAPGGARWADLPVYEPTESTWSVTPLVGAATTLNTAGNYLDRDIVIQAIPYAEVSNQTGGKTATIGG